MVKSGKKGEKFRLGRRDGFLHSPEGKKGTLPGKHILGGDSSAREEPLPDLDLEETPTYRREEKEKKRAHLPTRRSRKRD